MTPAEEDEFVRTAFHSDNHAMKLEDTFRLAIRAAYAKGAEDERTQWESVRTAVAIGQHLKPYQPISEENACEMLDDIQQGIADRADAIRRG